jgi:hypothetical protein
MYKPSIYIPSSYLFSYLFTYIWDLSPRELGTKLKPNINWDEGVEVHPQLSNNGCPMDGVLVGAGSVWPVHRISPCQKSTYGVRFARLSDGRHHVFDACSSLKLVPTQRKLTCIKAWQIRIIIVAPEAHFHEPFFASLDLDVRNIFAESHPEHRWECSNHLASHLQNRSLSLSLSL